MQERYWLIGATVAALISTGWSAYATGARATIANRWNYFLLLLGFLAQTMFLYLRGHAEGRCPHTNFNEITAFLAWSVLLTYGIVGSTYRMSILGAFTSPVVFVLNFLALVVPLDYPAGQIKPGWEMDACSSLSILAYGVFGIGALTGLMVILQDRHLKQRDLSGLFYRLPAIGDLETVQERVLGLGFAMLTGGMLLGLHLTWKVGFAQSKLAWIAGVWLFYLFLVAAPRVLHISHRKTAWLACLGYFLVLACYAGLQSPG